jgi:hypothetical protein
MSNSGIYLTNLKNNTLTLTEDFIFFKQLSAVISKLMPKGKMHQYQTCGLCGWHPNDPNLPGCDVCQSMACDGPIVMVTWYETPIKDFFGWVVFFSIVGGAIYTILHVVGVLIFLDGQPCMIGDKIDRSHHRGGVTTYECVLEKAPWFFLEDRGKWYSTGQKNCELKKSSRTENNP